MFYRYLGQGQAIQNLGQDVQHPVCVVALVPAIYDVSPPLVCMLRSQQVLARDKSRGLPYAKTRIVQSN
jgi:hypothetical protein